MRVMVVSASAMAQAGMAALVEGTPGLEVAAAVGEPAARDAAATTGPDVVLFDLGSGRLEALRELLSAARCPVVVVCEEGDADAALAVGALGALAPGLAADQLAPALEAACAGLQVRFPPAPRAPLGEERSSHSEGGVTVDPLTPRELEILRLLPGGLTNQQIGARLGITENTVKFHVSAVLGKLGAQSRAEAVNRAYQVGLISL